MAAHYCFAKWEKDSASPSCRSCGADFGLTTRRHHCRYCGRLFCVKCANQQAHAELLPPLQRRSEFSTAYRAQKVVRLCVGCADGLRGLCAALAKGEARAAGYFLDGTSDDDAGLRGLLWPLARDAAGASFAHLAVGSGSLDAVRWLCERRVAVTPYDFLPTLLRQKDRHGRTPLALAAADGHVAILRYLAVDRGAALADADAALRAILGALLHGPTPSRRPRGGDGRRRRRHRRQARAAAAKLAVATAGFSDGAVLATPPPPDADREQSERDACSARSPPPPSRRPQAGGRRPAGNRGRRRRDARPSVDWGMAPWDGAAPRSGLRRCRRPPPAAVAAPPTAPPPPAAPPAPPPPPHRRRRRRHRRHRRRRPPPPATRCRAAAPTAAALLAQIRSGTSLRKSSSTAPPPPAASAGRRAPARRPPPT